MMSNLYYLFVLVCCGITKSGADYARYYYDYECNEPLLVNAHLTATSSLRERGPENAKLHGTNAWTASDSDFDQHLLIDLGSVKNVTRIATQGRAHSQEYVEEYHIDYGTNGLDYAQYKASGGEIKMFQGNHDGNTVHRNEFEVPIIAQYVRINPMRWRDKISMRLELYGCDYVADTLYFNGTSLVKMDLLRDPISASREVIRFRFKTSTASGVLLYSRGTQGDYIALQLRDNRLVLNLDLGSGTATSLSVGSLLDDNLWHDVVLSRNRRDILFSVDRVVVQDRIKGEFSRLNLNRAVYIGGVPNFQEGLVVHQNFTGCVENLYLNATNVIQELKAGYDAGEPFKFEKVHTLYACPEPPIVPLTFLKEASYAKIYGYSGGNNLNVSLEFRTYENHGLLIYHQFKNDGEVKVFLEEGKIIVELELAGSPRVKLDNYAEEFNDGRWHALMLTMGVDNLVLSVDYRPVRTTKKLNLYTGNTYYIAGGKPPVRGFIGCMRKIAVDGNYRLPTDWKKEDYCCQNDVVFDACHMIDRCNPNPCEHGGVCTQTAEEFSCDCRNTGYAGAVCHTSVHPLSCTAYKNVQAVSRAADILIDVDGSGPLAPFPVTCHFYTDGRILTAVQHTASSGSVVDGYQEPGSFRQDVEYDASRSQLEALLNRSHSCQQRLEYMCRHSRLLNSPSEEATFRPFAWWVSRTGKSMDYWAGAPAGSRMCACGVLAACVDETKWCNCDAEYPRLSPEEFQTDGGEITDKEFLPVKQLRFGDTGSHLDEKEGRYSLGPLLCEGDDLFSNTVTFRISDAIITLPAFDLGHSGDIYFEFKTTKENAVLLHAKGPQDYIKLSIMGGDQLQFQFQVGDTPLGVSVETSNRLADNNWHSVSIERNRKEARVVVDGALKNEIRLAREPERALRLLAPLALGAALDRSDGFVGCMRALLLNGQAVDLREYARRGLYGVSEGCVGKCSSSPCLNNGTCLERYDAFSCDCRWTSFKGPICADGEHIVYTISCMSCLNNGTCLERYDAFSCDCRWTSFKGPICADGEHIVYTISCMSCLNNGTCLERYDAFSCDCRWTSFKGPICADGEHIVYTISCMSCLNNGTCLERYDAFSCDCRWTSFKGPICADGEHIVYTISCMSCLNNGTCLERYDAFSCDCRWTSFKGPICADGEHIVYTISCMSCLNNGTCLERYDAFSCDCRWTSFKGPICADGEHIVYTISCMSCLNNGTCLERYDAFSCDCRWTSFKGPICADGEHIVYTISCMSCLNNGTCLERYDAFSCDCRWTSFKGPICADGEHIVYTISCMSCLNNGTCLERYDAFSCDCRWTSFKGPICADGEHIVYTISCMSCLNNGTCLERYDAFSCDCRWTSFKGPICADGEHIVYTISCMSCLNNGTCLERYDAFSCDCRWTSFKGPICADGEHIVYTISCMSCLNNGTCLERYDAFSCDCRWTSFKGPICADGEHIVYTISCMSCLNNGTCLERYDAFSCDCRWTSFKGPICADGEHIVYTISCMSCLNNGTCLERYDAFSCDCRWTSFKGPICADGEHIVYTISCMSCLNNGTCLERYDAFSCDCRWTSFKGPICADGEHIVYTISCMSCLNNGTCLERYDAFSCDCRWTSFKGPICADEIGVNLRPNSMVKYDFLGSWRSTIAEKIRVGFTTTNPKGFLLGFYSNISAEYLTLMVSNSGHLRVVFDFGFERQEIVFRDKHFGLGQYHDVRFSRTNGGATVVLQVDNYETQEHNFNIKESADAQFNNIQYMYIGRNESMAEGFVGCVSRVEFDDIFPLKLLFQQDPPPNVRSQDGDGVMLHEDFCGVEPVTLAAERAETRAPPRAGPDADLDYHKTDEAILGTVLALIFVLLIIVAVVLVRALSRHKGEYLTQEERGAEGAADPDAAALAAATGPRVSKRREFFI
ncbi:neurexin-4 isoform X1 [Plodia interpunctella]|uniref:neurexin-4 isoform X1 n=1 Tax=Plodia interpunctella TaxID=58824 RepID=UPI0023680FFC|nr:neurexin-4 isoform X1 [Plodia interpunctella]